MKFNVGDKVRVARILNENTLPFSEKEFLGKIGKIIDIDEDDYPYGVDFEGLIKGLEEKLFFMEEELELAQDFAEELVSVLDEVIKEELNGETLSENDHLEVELAKQMLLLQLKSEIKTAEDEAFMLDNLDIFKRIFKAVLKEDEVGVKVAFLELLKKKTSQMS